MTEADVIGALTDPQVIAITLWGEARGATPHLRAGVASVILNRVKAQHHAWGWTARDVCLKPWQFSCWKVQGGASNHQTVLDTAGHLLRGDAIGPVLKGCLALAAQVCDGTLTDTVNGATMYYSPASMEIPGAVPQWAVGIPPVAQIDGTKFFQSY